MSVFFINTNTTFNPTLSNRYSFIPLFCSKQIVSNSRTKANEETLKHKLNFLFGVFSISRYLLFKQFVGNNNKKVGITISFSSFISLDLKLTWSELVLLEKTSPQMTSFELETRTLLLLSFSKSIFFCKRGETQFRMWMCREGEDLFS